MEHPSIDHPPMQPGSQRGVGAPLEKQAQRHQMDGNGLNSARIVTVWMLYCVGVDDELMKGHTPRIGVLHGEQLAVAQPASGRAGHVRMRCCFDCRQPDSAAWTNSLKAVHDHPAFMPERYTRPTPNGRRDP